MNWISVDERLPDVEKFVIWFWEEGWITFDARDHDDKPQNWSGATHWMQIDPPEGVPGFNPVEAQRVGEG